MKMEVGSALAVAAALAISPQQGSAQSTGTKKPPTVIAITLQKAPNNMEPVAEPSRIRVDDRSSVIIRLVNLSPLDVCSLSGRTVAPTAETNPIESLVGTIAALGAFSIGAGAAQTHLDAIQTSTGAQLHTLDARTSPGQPSPPPPIFQDAEYRRFLAGSDAFHRSAARVAAEEQKSRQWLQADLQRLSNYMGADYRETNWKSFYPEQDSALKPVRDDFNNALPSITTAAQSQALLTELVGWASDLHKNYDKATDSETQDALQIMDETLEKAKAAMSILSDNITTLKAAQTTLQGSYLAAVKVYADFVRSKDTLHIIRESEDHTVLIQEILLGTDRKATITGVVSCVSDVDGKTPTTDAINYSILYQDVPRLTASAGFLVTFLGKREIGIKTVAATNPAGFNQIFAVTDSSSAQVFPMAFVNWRLGGYHSMCTGKTKENEKVVTGALSAGFGVNPNSGTNQPEFFVGAAIGINRLIFHPGVHFGRTQSLGGGFTLNSTVPMGFPGSAPISWSYHPAFSIGFSVRVAPF